MQREPTQGAFTCTGFGSGASNGTSTNRTGKEVYPGFCRRLGSVNGWFDDLLGIGAKVEGDVKKSAADESRLTLWRIAAVGTLAVAGALLIFKRKK